MEEDSRPGADEQEAGASFDAHHQTPGLRNRAGFGAPAVEGRPGLYEGHHPQGGKCA